MTETLRTLWAWKKATRVSRRARCEAPSVGQRSRKAEKTAVSLSRNHCKTWGKYSLSRWVMRLVRRTRSSNEIAAALDQATEHAHGRRLLVKRRELVAMAGEDVDRDLGVAGVVLGSTDGEGAAVARQGRGVDWEESTKKSCSSRAETMGPCVSSMQTAMGPPWNRARRSRAQASMAAGRCSTTDSSGAAEPGTHRQTSCF